MFHIWYTLFHIILQEFNILTVKICRINIDLMPFKNTFIWKIRKNTLLPKYNFSIYLFIYLFTYLLTYFLIERGREGERDGQKYQCVVASHVPPTGNLARNPGMCLDWESNKWPFGLEACTQSTEPNQSGQTFKMYYIPVYML